MSIPQRVESRAKGRSYYCRLRLDMEENFPLIPKLTGLSQEVVAFFSLEFFIERLNSHLLGML